jgi:hypothetical protein
MLVRTFPHPKDSEPQCLARERMTEGPFCKVCGYRWEAHALSHKLHGTRSRRSVQR